jgi:hypothetical protein
VVQEFNKGVYDYIIATDEGGNEQDEEDSGSESLQEADRASRKSSCAHCILPLNLAPQLSVAQKQTASLTPVDASASGHPHHQSKQAVTKNAGV